MGNCASEPKVHKGAADEVPQPPPADLVPAPTQEGELNEGDVKVEGEKTNIVEGEEAVDQRNDEVVENQLSLGSLLHQVAPEKEEEEVVVTEETEVAVEKKEEEADTEVVVAPIQVVVKEEEEEKEGEKVEAEVTEKSAVKEDN